MVEVIHVKSNKTRLDFILTKHRVALSTRIMQNGERVTAEHAINQLRAIDDTKNSKYLQWLTIQYLRGQFRLEDAARVSNDLHLFREIKNKLEQRDINRYTYYTLSDLIDKEYNIELNNSVDNAGQENDNKDIQVLYDGPLGNLSIPLTQEASCKLGRGTRWCTAMQNYNMFDEYSSEGSLYIWRDNAGNKYQFHFGKFLQFMDSRDRPINDLLLGEFRSTHPVLNKLFMQYEKQVLESNIPMQIVGYAHNVIKGRWVSAEHIVMNDVMATFCYIRDVIKGPWTEAETVITKSVDYSFYYARDILQKRWPEAETVIMKDVRVWKKYCEHFEIVLGE